MITQRTADYNSSTGTFGKWDPLTYRFLSQKGDERLDLSTAEWLELNGDRVVGGGPATTSRDGKPLTDLKADAQQSRNQHPELETGKPKHGTGMNPARWK